MQIQDTSVMDHMEHACIAVSIQRSLTASAMMLLARTREASLASFVKRLTASEKHQ